MDKYVFLSDTFFVSNQFFNLFRQSKYYFFSISIANGFLWTKIFPWRLLSLFWTQPENPNIQVMNYDHHLIVKCNKCSRKWKVCTYCSKRWNMNKKCTNCPICKICHDEIKKGFITPNRNLRRNGCHNTTLLNNQMGMKPLYSSKDNGERYECRKCKNFILFDMKC